MSQSPLLSQEAPIPIASVPDEQAFTTVWQGPAAPSDRAITREGLLFKNRITGAMFGWLPERNSR